MLVNTPHNPSGTILTEEDARQLAALAVKYDLAIISDEAYESQASLLRSFIYIRGQS